MNGGPKILIVDDNPDNLELLVARLRSSGYQTIEASDGEQALALVNEEPDLIILDVMMPKLDGLEVCRRLKSDDSTKMIPIIMLTAKSDVPAKIKGLDTGADDYVGKPFEPPELMARIRGLLKQRMIQKKRATQDKLGALGQMAEGVAHEVRNPMVAIGGFARRIRDKLPYDSPLREYAGHIIKEVERLEKMVEEIVEFKSLMIFPHEPVDLRAEIEAALKSRNVAEKKIEIIRNYCDGSTIINGDRANILLVFEKIIDNALEAMDEKGTLSIDVSSTGNWEVVNIGDTGCGISKHDLANLFDPFYTSKMKGAGVGLTMVHSIMTKHGGEVDITSEPGKGASVSLRFPKIKQVEK